MGDFYFYDLPVYRLGKDDYYKALDALIETQVQNLRTIPGYEPAKSQIDWMKQHQYERFGPWNFNEVIGYIRLYLLGSQIRGEYFSAEKKRNSLGRTKVFVWRSFKLAAEVDIDRFVPATNQLIWGSIQKYVERCRKELKRGRVIDDSLLQTVGPHVDWLAVFGWQPIKK
ncbi:MAG: hypothetical protein B7Z31_02400 [Rhodobacterales bacterium 12-65-15]|nr:MAG: hypothetical protein B7Z31_02400 [Rhodobacterales bacterium 12-65-15]